MEGTDSQGDGPLTAGTLPWSRLAEIRILHLESDPDRRDHLAGALRRVVFSRSHRLILVQAVTLDEAIARLHEHRYGLLIASMELPGSEPRATLAALALHKGSTALCAYAQAPELDLVSEAFAAGAEHVFDQAVFDPRVLDQVLGTLAQRALADSSLEELLRGRDTLQAHRRERDRQMHRLVLDMLAVSLEPIPRDEAVDRVIGLLLGIDRFVEVDSVTCFVRDPANGNCSIAAQRGLTAETQAELEGLCLEDCTCLTLHEDGTSHFNAPGLRVGPACQVLCGEHASYTTTIIGHDGAALGTLALWVPRAARRDEFCDHVVENAGRVLASIISHHRQLDRVRRMDQIVEQSPLTVIVTDRAGTITYANPTLYRLTGYSPEEVLGSNPRLFASGLVSDETFAEMWALLGSGESWDGELINRKKNGDLLWEEASISPVFDDKGRIDGYVAVKRDITEVLQYKARLEHQTTHDALTDLVNRSLLGDRVMLAIQRARRQEDMVVALLIDLDDFGAINQNHGHATGDQVLREVAQRLTALARSYDTVARLGNDEFAVLVTDIAEESAVLNLAERYLRALEQPIACDGVEIGLTASIGVASYPLDSADGKDLLRHAGMALDRQKRTGANGYALFGQEMEEDLRERYTLTTALRSAIDAMQLELHYQPQVDPDSGALGGAEALLRWHLPGSGLVSPMKFIPLAEASGLIVPIGAWVLANACEQWVALGKQLGCDLPISVNVSESQFREAGFFASVEQALARSQLDPRLLVLELTESLLLQDAEETRVIMERLRHLGVRLAIDDFGTGYSSLSYLTKLPIHQLKVDRAFIRDLEIAPNNEVIVSTIISMAHNLGMEVVAEGAETPDHVGFLHTYRCDLIQGYHYSKPLPLEQFIELVRSPPWITNLETDPD